MAENITTVLSLPDAGTLSNTDIVYIAQGEGLDRDRKVTIERLAALFNADNELKTFTVDGTTTVDFENWDRNAVVNLVSTNMGTTVTLANYSNVVLGLIPFRQMSSSAQALYIAMGSTTYTLRQGEVFVLLRNANPIVIPSKSLGLFDTLDVSGSAKVSGSLTAAGSIRSGEASGAYAEMAAGKVSLGNSGSESGGLSVDSLGRVKLDSYRVNASQVVTNSLDVSETVSAADGSFTGSVTAPAVNGTAVKATTVDSTDVDAKSNLYAESAAYLAAVSTRICQSSYKSSIATANMVLLPDYVQNTWAVQQAFSSGSAIVFPKNPSANVSAYLVLTVIANPNSGGFSSLKDVSFAFFDSNGTQIGDTLYTGATSGFLATRSLASYQFANAAYLTVNSSVIAMGASVRQYYSLA